MISVVEAERLVRAAAVPLGQCSERPLVECCGLVLQEDLIADRDLPPFDRVAMDGIAVRGEDLRAGLQSFRRIAEQAAGVPRLSLNESGTCIEIMTGAALPEHATHVVPYERTSRVKDTFQIDPQYAALEQTNIHDRGSDHRQHDLLVAKGSVINPFVIATAASVGKTQLKTLRPLKITMVATGDELIEVAQTPRDYQIRRSNDYAIGAMLQAWGGVEFNSLHIRDDKNLLATALSKALEQCDVLVLSGGVSMGKYDFVPAVLADIGVKELFHKVSQRPGKPLWFGQQPGTEKVVFGLPGNPVSSLVNARRYVVTFIEQRLSLTKEPIYYAATAAAAFAKNFTLYKPVKITDRQQRTVTPLQANGSGDFSSLVQADGFIEVPAQDSGVIKGKAYPFYGWRPDA